MAARVKCPKCGKEFTAPLTLPWIEVCPYCGRRFWRRKGLLLSLLIVAVFFGFAVIIAVAHFLDPKPLRKAYSNENAAIAVLRKVHQAQEQYKSQFGRCAISYRELAGANMLSPAFAESIEAGKVRSGYHFLMLMPGDSWELTAMPIKPGVTGTRSFYINGYGTLTYLPCKDKNAPDPGMGDPLVGEPFYHFHKNEATAVSCLRTISSAQEIYYSRHRKYATLSGLFEADMLAKVLAIATSPEHAKSGYYYLLTISENGWSCTALPSEPVKTGKRSFYIDQNDIVHYAPCESADDALADENSTPLGK